MQNLSPFRLLLVFVGLASAGQLPPNWYAIKGAAADSAWNLEEWSVELAYRNGYSFGDLLSEEQDMADRMGLTVKQYGDEQDAMVMLQTIGLSVGAWRRISTAVDFGAGWAHRWSLESASGAEPYLLLSEDVYMLQGRWFPLRRLVWQFGPQFGVGYATGSLSRFPILEDLSEGDIGTNEAAYWLNVAHESIEIGGPRIEIGAVFEIRLEHWISFGGNLLLGRTAWSVEGDDPMEATNVGYPKDPVEYDVELGVQAAYRF